MSITVLDCLRLPSLKNATVIAGKAGLKNIVNSVSVLEYTDDDLLTDRDQTYSNEMLLSAFAAVRDDVESQCKIIELSKNTGDVCLILYYLGLCLNDVDPRVIRLADELSFPIITMPKSRRDLRYSEVIGDVYEAIIRDKNKNKALINNISEQVSRLPEDKRNIKNLMRMISDRLRCSLLLSDSTTTAVHLTKWPLSNNLTAEDIYGYFAIQDHNKETYFQTELDGSPVSFFHVSFSAPEYRTLSLYMVDEANSISIDDVYQSMDALQLFSNMWNLTAANMLEDALIPSIIENKEQRMRQIASKLNIDIAVINTLLLIRLEGSFSNPHEKLKAKTRFIHEAKTTLLDCNRTPIVDLYSDYLTILISYSVLSSVDQQFISSLQTAFAQLHVPYSLTICSSSQTTADVREAYLLYEKNINTVRCIFPLHTIYTYSDLEFADQCSQIVHGDTGKSHIYARFFTPLDQFNNKQELIDTLAVYLLDANMETKKTCDLLFLHRNTVQYRLGKIKSALNCNLANMSEIHLALTAAAIYRIRSTS